MPRSEKKRDQQLELMPSRPNRLPTGAQSSSGQLFVAGLFAGVGGLELGLERAGHGTNLLCEFESGADAVLAERFPTIHRHGDVRTLRRLPRGTTLLTAGFPCQDLSQAGKTAGIQGARSGLVGEVFRLLEHQEVPWVLLENVPFMLQLAGGKALDVIVTALERLGYKWAYRVVDSRAFGVPQRRERVYLLASKAGDPRDHLLSEDAGEPNQPSPEGRAFGFYWTEGIRGLGAAIDAVPTLKGGSTIGIPSPPAILLPDGRIVKPDIRDAERLQGFPVDWTQPSERVARRGHRWKLVGNAVTVDAARWLGQRLLASPRYDPSGDAPLRRKGAWPRAAWGIGGDRFRSSSTAWPRNESRPSLEEFLKFPPQLLSARGIAGFLERTTRGSLRFPPGFIEACREHLNRMTALEPAA